MVIASGYFANPAQTAIGPGHGRRRPSRLRTGDIAHMDEEGYFHIVDRKKDMIIRSGMKVYPARVEAALHLHEKVADAGVIGRPDTVHTEQVVAFVVPVGEVTDRDALADELRKFCRKHLAAYEVPAKIEFVEKTLPRLAHWESCLAANCASCLPSKPNEPGNNGKTSIGFSFFGKSSGR